MAEFSAVANLAVQVDDASLRAANRQIAGGLSDPAVGASARPDGGRSRVEELLEEQNDILRDLEGGGGGIGAGGGFLAGSALGGGLSLGGLGTVGLAGGGIALALAAASVFGSDAARDRDQDTNVGPNPPGPGLTLQDVQPPNRPLFGLDPGQFGTRGTVPPDRAPRAGGSKPSITNNANVNVQVDASLQRSEVERIAQQAARRAAERIRSELTGNTPVAGGGSNTGRLRR